jgi:hypothetical protein
MNSFRIWTTVILVGIALTAAEAQESSWEILWDPPILLSDSTRPADYLFPSVAVSGEDTVHVTWTGGEEHWPYARSTDGGISFVRSDLIPETSSIGHTWFGRVVASGQGVIAVADGPGVGDIHPLLMRRSQDGGGEWEPVNVLADTGWRVNAASVSGDTVVFSFLPPPGYMEIMRSTDFGTSWRRTQQRFHEDSRATFSNGFVHLIEPAGGGFLWGLRYRRSRDLGDTWDDMKYIAPPITGFLYLDPRIVARSTAEGDYVLAVWRDPSLGCGGTWLGCTIAGRIGKVEADSTRWYPVRVLSTMPTGFVPELAGSKRGFAAGWPMDHEGPPFAELRLSEDTAWGGAYDPAPPTAGDVGDVVMALSATAVHVAWGQGYQILYRRGRLVTTGVVEPGGVPEEMDLDQNHPNPFNGETRIRYRITGGARDVTLRVFDVLGREVGVLVSEPKSPGVHTAVWNAGALASGVYIVRLDGGGKSMTRKAVLIR